MDHSPELQLQGLKNYVIPSQSSSVHFTFLEKCKAQRHQMPRRKEIFTIFTLKQNYRKVLYQSIKCRFINSFCLCPLCVYKASKPHSPRGELKENKIVKKSFAANIFALSNSTYPRVLPKLMLQFQSYVQRIGEKNQNKSSHKFKSCFIR